MARCTGTSFIVKSPFTNQVELRASQLLVKINNAFSMPTGVSILIFYSYANEHWEIMSSTVLYGNATSNKLISYFDDSN